MATSESNLAIKKLGTQGSAGINRAHMDVANIRRINTRIPIFQDNERDLLQILGQETARDILLFIIERKNPTQTDIAARMRISPASVNWQIKRLIR